MLSTVRTSRSLLFRPRKFKKFTRTFLSSSYPCIDAWNRRFESPLLSKVKPSDMFVEIDQKFQASKTMSAVDLDIFVQSIKNDDDRSDEIVDLLHKLRLTMQTTNTLDSTHHAVIRYFLAVNDKGTLLEVLNDRLNYGIFPDHFCYNLMMDTFIKEKDFASAAKIATLLMLQEDNDHPITNALAVYSCHKYLEKPDDWLPPPPPPPVDPKEEVVKVRVRYLRNPYFDDHFDLVVPKHLVGKTLVFFGRNQDDALGRSMLLRGYVLWEKYEKAQDIVKTWIDSGINEVVYKEALELVHEELKAIPEEKVNDHVKNLMELVEKMGQMELKEGRMEEEMEERILKAISEREKSDIEEQCKLYEEWEIKRMDILNKQLQQFDRENRVKRIEAMKKDLVVRERLLTFFENEEKLELQIEDKLKAEEEKFGPPIEVKEDLEENYVPPEIRQTTKNV